MNSEIVNKKFPYKNEYYFKQTIPAMNQAYGPNVTRYKRNGYRIHLGRHGQFSAFYRTKAYLPDK